MNKRIVFPAVLVFMFCFSSSHALAAATTTENFDSYTNGNALDGGSGSSNWTNGWAKSPSTTGVMTTDTAPAGGQGGLAAHSIATTTQTQYQRDFPAISAGTLQFQFFYSDVTTGQQVSVCLDDSTNTGGAVNNHRACAQLNVTAGGDIDGSDGQTYNTAVGTFTANTWNTVAIKFDNSIGNVFQVSVNGGAYSGNLASGGSLVNIDRIFVLDENTEAHDSWIDDVSIAGSSGSSGTLNQLAKFITSNTFGNALLADDGSNTTLTSGNFYMQVGALIDSVTNGDLSFGTTNANTLSFGRSGQSEIFNGSVGIGTSTPVGSPLAIGGVASFTTATSTFYGNGINLSSGCFAVKGVCINGSASSSGSGVSSIAQTFGTPQTGPIIFATSSATFNGLTVNQNISNSGGTFTFKPTLSGSLGVLGGGTGSTTALGGILVGNGFGFIRSLLLGAGLAFNGTSTLTVATSSLSIGGTAANVTGTVAVANGGTGVSTLHGILFGNGTIPLQSLTIGSGLTLSSSTLSVATSSNCSSSTSPAVCGSAPSGSVAMATGGSTLVVDTTAVTANSQILVTEDSSLGTRLGITCNTTTGRVYTISARTAGTSFTIKSSANPATNKACLSYSIIN